MTKIQIDDGKDKKSVSTKKKTAKKIIVVDDAPKTEKKVEKKKIEVKKVEEKKSISHQASTPVSSAATHNILQKSTTLSRRYVKKPGAEKTEAKAEAKTEAKVKAKTKKTEAKSTTRSTTFARIAAKNAARAAAKTAAKKERENRAAARLAEKRLRAEREQVERAERAAKAQAEKAAKAAAKKAAAAAKKPTSCRIIKKSAAKPSKNDRAIKSATAVIAKMAEDKPATETKMQHTFRKKHKAHRIFLALLCSGATVAALVAFVHFSIPDLSVRVAAIQTGIEATYPTFVPRNYNLGNVVSDKDGIVIMNFEGPDNSSFTLSEEKSTWDSTALLNNYVKKVYPSDFSTMREQGITIYVRGEKASWVNGGMLYKIESSGKYLTKEQIRNIATSL